MAASMPTDRRPPRSPAPATFVAGTRATAPVPLEETSESAWQMFQELQRVHGQPVSQSKDAPPASVPKGFEATQPMQAAAPPSQAQTPPRPAGPVASLDAVMQLARRNNRACPLPEPWAALHRHLPPRLAGGKSYPAPAPVDGGAWGVTSAMQKRLRLRDQIEWAEREKGLQAVFEFLLGLREEEWHHFG